MSAAVQPRRRSPWRFTRRITDALGAQLIPGRHLAWRVRA